MKIASSCGVGREVSAKLRSGRVLRKLQKEGGGGVQEIFAQGHGGLE